MLALLPVQCIAQNDPVREIQVLIDVSGSMKQNDPDNLRIDAARLLINLLPDGSRVSIWLFAEDTQRLIHSDSTDRSWKDKAKNALGKVHSRGLFTNIEKAISQCLNHGFDQKSRRHLILLTDGMVDISQDIMVSADSRERIFAELIPKLRERDIQVETIALSDQTDTELLQQLAETTGGWHEAAATADQLQRSFMKMLQKTAPTDNVPINGNRFLIDSSVSEFSVVVFKTAGSKPTLLETPDGKILSKQVVIPNIGWADGKGYDLITVKQPVAGEWLLDAATDPDNQVMILTDLKLQADHLPSFTGPNDPLSLSFYFTEKGQLINRKEFVALTNMELAIDSHPSIQLEASQATPGYFHHQLSNLPEGRHQLRVIADGKTFKRELLHTLDVKNTSLTVKHTVDNAHQEIHFIVVPDTTALDQSSLKVTATVKRPDHVVENYPISQTDGAWLFTLKDLPKESGTLVTFSATASNKDGKLLSLQAAPIKIDEHFLMDSPQLVEEQVEQNPQHATEDAPEHSDHEEATAAAHTPIDHSESAAESTDWGLVSIILISLNLLTVGLGWLAYKQLTMATLEKQQELLERLT